MNKEPRRVGVSRLLPLRLLTRIAHGKQVEWCHAEVRVSPLGEIMIQRIGCHRLAASRTVVQLVSMQPFGEDRKSTRLNSITNAHLVCRLLLVHKNVPKTSTT